uniref:Male-enhanced antigen 1 n=1 Tax=Glossina pallidipes TaxID=7398 RepID=A0A1A9ZEU6_GLOPL
MGSPELPDPGEDDLRATQIAYNDIGEADDESDNGSIQDDGNYEGYEPLAMDDMDYDNTIQIENHNYEPNNRAVNEEESSPATHDNFNLPSIESIDVELEREVWIQPRPQELQIELDNNKTQQILNAMANFNLASTAVPEWATGVSEDSWKEELLQRIRERAQLANRTNENLKE